MLRIGVVTGSTRPERHNEAVAPWVFDLATERTDAEFELVDMATYNLPLLDEPLPPHERPRSRSGCGKGVCIADSSANVIWVTSRVHRCDRCVSRYSRAWAHGRPVRLRACTAKKTEALRARLDHAVVPAAASASTARSDEMMRSGPYAAIDTREEVEGVRFCANRSTVRA